MAQDFEKLNIQWFPGHMTKAQRMIEEHMKQVDAVCEILDARIPMASRNPDIDRLAGDKPRIVVLNRTDLADPKATARWRAAFQRQGMTVLETDSRSGNGTQAFSGAVAMGTTTGSGATGACSPSGLMSSGPRSFAASGAK